MLEEARQAIEQLEDMEERLLLQLDTGANPDNEYFLLHDLCLILDKSEEELMHLAKNAMRHIQESPYGMYAYEVRIASHSLFR